MDIDIAKLKAVAKAARDTRASGHFPENARACQEYLKIFPCEVALELIARLQEAGALIVGLEEQQKFHDALALKLERAEAALRKIIELRTAGQDWGLREVAKSYFNPPKEPTDGDPH